MKDDRTPVPAPVKPHLRCPRDVRLSFFRRCMSSFFRHICCCTSLAQVEKFKGRLVAVKTSHKDEDECRMRMTPEEFLELVNARQAERKKKAEEECFHGLEHIKEEISDPLELFPREIWLKILGKMKPVDRVSMYNAHDLFCCLLGGLLPVLLDNEMPLVQPYLAPVKGNDYFWYKRRLDLTPLKTLRLVSKSCLDAVDRWFENRLLHIMRNSELMDVTHYRHYFGTCRLLPDSNRDFKVFLGGGEERPKRFFLRSLSLNFNRRNPDLFYEGQMGFSDEQISVFMENVTELLEKVGSQVLHFDLDSIGMMPILLIQARPVTFYDVVRKWLLLMPNLKWLKIIESRFYMDVSLSLEELPFPSLCGLERIDFYSPHEESGRTLRALLSANPHVKYFSHPFGTLFTPMIRYRNPLVSSLPLESVSLKDGRYFWNSPTQLHQIPTDNWNLKRMTLCLGMREGPYLNLQNVLHFLQKFQTLEKVELQLNRLMIGKELDFLQLPNLMDFHMQFGPVLACHCGESPFFFSLQFLVHCQKLRSLHWEELTSPEDSPPERTFAGAMIDFNGGIVDLSKSNVWDVFPEMRTIKVVYGKGKGMFVIGKWSVLEMMYRDRELVKEQRPYPDFI